MFGPLLTDLYQLTMLQAYFDRGMHERASFEFFVRRLPAQRNFLVAAGLEQVLQFLQDLRFGAPEIDWLAGTGRFRPAFLPADRRALEPCEPYAVEVSALLSALARSVDARTGGSGSGNMAEPEGA